MGIAIPTQGIVTEIEDSGNPGTYFTIPGVTSISGPDSQKSEIDTTALDDSAKSYITGLVDNGSLTLNINYVPDNAVHELLRAAAAANNQTDKFRITFTDVAGTTWTFDGQVQSFPLNLAIESKAEVAVAVRITGAIAVA